MLRRSAETADETVQRVAQFDPVDLVPLSALASEGFGWTAPHVATPLAAINALAARLDGEVVLDDIGRRCVSRETAKRVFTERVELEVRRREIQERQDAQFAEQAAANRVWAGIPADLIPDGVTPAAAMLEAGKAARPRRQSVLEHALANDDGFVYHPLEGEQS